MAKQQPANIEAKFNFKVVEWEDESEAILSIRQMVFILEQRFGSNMLIDHNDPFCHHLLVKDQTGDSVACGRINQNGRIGRIAVLINYRNQGIGTYLLSQLIRIGQKNQVASLSLNAETSLSHFYDQQQFSPTGPVYMKQGIPHQKMIKHLS